MAKEIKEYTTEELNTMMDNLERPITHELTHCWITRDHKKFFTRTEAILHQTMLDEHEKAKRERDGRDKTPTA